MNANEYKFTIVGDNMNSLALVSDFLCGLACCQRVTVCFCVLLCACVCMCVCSPSSRLIFISPPHVSSVPLSQGILGEKIRLRESV